jgi:hypothetical protein
MTIDAGIILRLMNTVGLERGLASYAPGFRVVGYQLYSLGRGAMAVTLRLEKELQ